jgi:hypothetical protein
MVLGWVLLLLSWRVRRSRRRDPHPGAGPGTGAGARIRTARWDSTARTLDYRHTR